MGRVEGKVAFITGAARGQGRSHALRLAEEGADIVAVDISGGVDSVEYALPVADDLQRTAEAVRALGRSAIVEQVDVRDLEGLERVAAKGREELGHIDIVCANAGIASYAPAWELTPRQWQDMIDVNLTGVWNTIKATVPGMIDAGRGGSIIITSSFGGLRGITNAGHYSAAKHGVVGLARVLAQELAGNFIRVNTLNPQAVRTGMVDNAQTLGLFGVEGDPPRLEDAREVLMSIHAMPIPWVEPEDVSNAVLWLASDESRYVTGVSLPVDGGALQKMPG